MNSKNIQLNKHSLTCLLVYLVVVVVMLPVEEVTVEWFSGVWFGCVLLVRQSHGDDDNNVCLHTRVAVVVVMAVMIVVLLVV